MGEIQAIYGLKEEWEPKELLNWIRSHKMEPIKEAHIKGTEIRYRIREPTYKSYITKKIMVYLKYATFNKHRYIYFVLGKT